MASFVSRTSQKNGITIAASVLGKTSSRVAAETTVLLLQL
jgi:hypothetical protein